MRPQVKPPTAGDAALSFHHVDGSTDSPMAGNGVTVVRTEQLLPSELMLRIAQELPQFETIFLSGIAGDTVKRADLHA